VEAVDSWLDPAPSGTWREASILIS